MKPKHPHDPDNYDINAKPSNEESDEAFILHEDDFLDHCLDLYDVIKFGTRKERKRAAQELVLLAVAMKDAFVTADNELKAAAHDVARGEEASASVPAADVTAAPSDLPTQGSDNGSGPIAETGAVCGTWPYGTVEHPGC